MEAAASQGEAPLAGTDRRREGDGGAKGKERQGLKGCFGGGSGGGESDGATRDV